MSVQERPISQAVLGVKKKHELKTVETLALKIEYKSLYQKILANERPASQVRRENSHILKTSSMSKWTLALAPRHPSPQNVLRLRAEKLESLTNNQS